jgi:hypothetical protein
VARGLLSLERCRANFLAPSDIEPPEFMHSKTRMIDSSGFCGRPKDVLLQVTVVRWIAAAVSTAEDKLIVTFASSEAQ